MTREGAESQIVERVRALAQPLSGAADDYDALLEQIGDARFVLLGEASHGTHEFYRERAMITQRLISEKGFTAVAVEADWPDAHRIHRFVQGGADEPSIEALSGFDRFPTWMWRNADVLDFVGWLRAHNDALAPARRKVGFYGLDLYSLHASIEVVLGYLDQIDPAAARRARERYACFASFGEEPQAYGYAASLGLEPSCEEAVLAQLMDLRQRADEYSRRDGRIDEDAHFYAEQNARVAMNAEAYYRTMFRGQVASWNLRDRHMMETLEAVVAYLDRTRERAKVVVWAHNSHLGDARATESSRRGELNLGQLVRERYGSDAVLVGFTTFSGTVTAASDWGDPPERKHVRPALPGSYEALFHKVGLPRFLLNLRQDAAAKMLREPRLERAIGVIYRPESERISHYFHARLAEQFDTVLHFDTTRAVEPLERTAGWERGEAPETFPTGV